MPAYQHSIPAEVAQYARMQFQGSDAQKLIRAEIDGLIEELKQQLESVPPEKLLSVQESLRVTRRIRDAIIHVHDRRDTQEAYGRPS